MSMNSEAHGGLGASIAEAGDPPGDFRSATGLVALKTAPTMTYSVLQVWSKMECTPSSEWTSYHDHEHPTLEIDQISYMDELRFRGNLRQPPFVRTCNRPHPRTMAAAFIYNNCLFITGGRDRRTTVACDFFVPLRPRPQTLKEFTAQFLVDHSIPCGGSIPSEVQQFMTGMHLGHMQQYRPSGHMTNVQNLHRACPGSLSCPVHQEHPH